MRERASDLRRQREAFMKVETSVGPFSVSTDVETIASLPWLAVKAVVGLLFIFWPLMLSQKANGGCTATSQSDIRLTKVCRSSRGVQPGPILAAAQMARKDRRYVIRASRDRMRYTAPRGVSARERPCRCAGSARWQELLVAAVLRAAGPVVELGSVVAAVDDGSRRVVRIHD
jgi:hypothetical protein